MDDDISPAVRLHRPMEMLDEEGLGLEGMDAPRGPYGIRCVSGHDSNVRTDVDSCVPWAKDAFAEPCDLRVEIAEVVNAPPDVVAEVDIKALPVTQAHQAPFTV